MDSKIVLIILGISIAINIGLIVAVIVVAVDRPDGDNDSGTKNAICNVAPNPSIKLDNQTREDNPIKGKVEITEESDHRLKVAVNLMGFKTANVSRFHGFHVHTHGDIFTDGCHSAGGHFNPDKKHHGSRDNKHDERHVGDWGNIEVRPDGTVTAQFEDDLARLVGSKGVLGRAIVIHAGQDDLGRGGNAGSKASGNAGQRLACCVIVAA